MNQPRQITVERHKHGSDLTAWTTRSILATVTHEAIIRASMSDI